MTVAAQKLTLEQRVEALCTEHEDGLDAQEVAGVVASLMQTMEGEVTLADLSFREELGDLVEYIDRAREEIAALNPHSLSQKKIPDASDELDAIVLATEEAAGQIMDAAEEIETLAAKSRGKTAEKLGEIATQIYEASSFQDITGQRVTKVVRTLKHLEEKLGLLAVAIGDSRIEDDPEIEKDDDGNIVNDSSLLHGPQMADAANSQDQIDALLASFDD